MDEQPDPQNVPASSSAPSPAQGARQAWFAPVLVIMLSAQLGLLWVQGGLLHRQHQEIRELREDIQTLVESLEAAPSEMGEETQGYSPSRYRPRPRHWHGLVPVRRLQAVTPESSSEPKPEPSPAAETSEGREEGRARKELEAAQASARQGVAEARDLQSKLSIEENIRRADEKAKIEDAQHTWHRWIWVALGVGVLAMIVRSWLRRRG